MNLSPFEQDSKFIKKTNNNYTKITRIDITYPLQQQTKLSQYNIHYVFRTIKKKHSN